MLLKQILDESFGDYRETAMLLVAPSCTWKCKNCHNHLLSELETKFFPDEEILKRFFANPLTSTIIFGGLEPLDSMVEVKDFVEKLYAKVFQEKLEKPTIIIYTGYELDEIEFDLKACGLWDLLKGYRNAIIKYGRFDPVYEVKDNWALLKETWNEDLGVYLASPNQNTINFLARIS